MQDPVVSIFASMYEQMGLSIFSVTRRSKTMFKYTFTSDNFEEEVLKSDVPVLVDMFATWCGPCKMMAPVVAQLAEEYEGTVKVGKLDIDQNVDIVAQYKIMSVPTFLVIKDGEVKAKLIGAVSKEELVEVIDQAK